LVTCTQLLHDDIKDIANKEKNNLAMICSYLSVK